MLDDDCGMEEPWSEQVSGCATHLRVRPFLDMNHPDSQTPTRRRVCVSDAVITGLRRGPMCNIQGRVVRWR
jgi:hypothetical protein